MAPEIIQGHRYDSKADIWSFAITAIELTQGRPPRSRERAHTVLLQMYVSCICLLSIFSHQLLSSVQGKPPALDRVGGLHQYSHAFKDIVDACLVKDPSKRYSSSLPRGSSLSLIWETSLYSPTAAQLLQTPFFKSAKKKSYLVSTILDGLPPLTMRQERRRRHPSVISLKTMDSWDFTEMNSPEAAPPIPSGLRRSASRSVSKSGSCDIGSDEARSDVRPRFDLSSRTNNIKEESTTIVRPSDNFRSLGPEKEEDELHLLSGPPLPRPSESSESAQSHTGYDAIPRLHSKQPPAYKPGSPGVHVPQFASRSVPAPMPIPSPRTSYFRKSSVSSSADNPSSSSPISPGLWKRLTSTTSRNAIDEELPVRGKKNGLSRILSRRSSASLSQRPVIS